MGLTQNEDLAPSPLAGEGWGEGVAKPAKTKAYANVTTLSPPRHQGGGSENLKSA